MTSPADVWYVRLPNGRVLTVAGSDQVRHHLNAGRIPGNVRVRRRDAAAWQGLGETAEFNDLAHPFAANGERPSAAPVHAAARRSASVASRLDPDRLHTLGVSAMGQELLAALDSTLKRNKLQVAVAASLLLGLVIALARLLWAELEGVGTGWLWGVVGGLSALIATVGNALVTQLTYVEVCNLRPATWAEGRARVGRLSLRLLVAYGLVCGVGLAAVALLRWLPHQYGEPTPEGVANWPQFAAQALAPLALVLEAAVWLLLGGAWLLAPAVVVEDQGLWRALGQWWWLLRQRLGRILVYEALAATIAGVILVPLTLPLLLTGQGMVVQGPLAAPQALAFDMLAALVAAPALAYLAVANVFIYLNLRYES